MTYPITELHDLRDHAIAVGGKLIDDELQATLPTAGPL